MRCIAAFASALLSACRSLLPAIELEPAAVEPSETKAFSAAAGSFSGIVRMRILQTTDMSLAQILMPMRAPPLEYVEFSVDRRISAVIGKRATWAVPDVSGPGVNGQRRRGSLREQEHVIGGFDDRYSASAGCYEWRGAAS